MKEPRSSGNAANQKTEERTHVLAQGKRCFEVERLNKVPRFMVVVVVVVVFRRRRNETGIGSYSKPSPARGERIQKSS
jgi:hypothetical protein